MGLFELISKRNAAYSEICRYLSDELSDLMVAADNMAECAAGMCTGKGYVSFINARESFLAHSKRLQKEIDSLNISPPH